MKFAIAVAMISFILASITVAAHDIDHPAVKVRVTAYDPATNNYTITCDVPTSSPGSQISDQKFYAIDPVPQGHNKSYSSYANNITWKLHPTAYQELVHTKAIYHMYCEVQNYSAPPGEQNMASEFHVDLRTDDNYDVPDIYVLASRGNALTMKCEPPDGTQEYDLTWAYRSRQGRVDLPELKNKQIVNITLPSTGSGWDIVCTVFDKFTGKTSSWDMPLETFENQPAYVPTIEGCVTHEPCSMFPQGVPNSSFTITTQPGTSLYINEKFLGITDGNGALSATAPPGVYNLVLRKEGFAELSTLLPLRAGQHATKSYELTLPAPPPDRWNMCHSTIYSLPLNCTGTVTADQASGGCRTIACSNGPDSIRVLACNKPTATNPQYFEMYKQSQTGNSVKLCIGNTCMRYEGYVKSTNFPICLGTGNQTNNTCTPSTEVCDGRDNDCDNQTDEGNVCGTTCTPTTEVCDGKDNNCNNQTDENNVCTQNSTCYNSVKDIPATCTGATISTDTWNGGRQITCGDLRVSAWDKSGFFEMYKQAGGSAVKLCIGETCIKDNGYAKSANFPICTGSNQTNNTCTPSTEVCDGRDNDCDNQTDEGNVCGTTCTPTTEVCDQLDNDCDGQVDESNVCTQNSTCYSNVQQMPASCTDGNITADEQSSGCRKVICASNTGSLQILACNKPGNYQPQYFEMYKQTATGTLPRICIAGTCIRENGYAKSANYPVCT